MIALRSVGAWLAARLDIRSQRGATAVEYGLFIGFIAAVLIMSVFFLGDETRKNLQCPAPPRAC
ncbi:MAG TPA: Flp family type IVb pilin [Actinomycetota bacterium]|nr:Flp family type IVb pilin [Actinomycetota bacterium]